MNIDCIKRFQDSAPARIIRRAIAVGLALLGVYGVVYAQEKAQERKDEFNFNTSIPSPVAPEKITPPVESTAFLLGHGVGTHGYVCLPYPTGGVSWTVNNARPEATLFTHIFGEAVQIITHFLSPVVNKIGPNPPRFGDATWQSPLDSSRVWAQRRISLPPAPTQVAQMATRLIASCSWRSSSRESRQNTLLRLGHPEWN